MLKKERILEVASEHFSRFGYSKTTMADIGRGVGLNKASLYYYYKNKEALFVEVTKKERKLFLKQTLQEIDSLDLYREQITTYISNSINFNKIRLNVLQISPDIINSIASEMQEVYNSARENDRIQFESLILRGVESGEFSSLQNDDTSRVAATIVQVVDSLLSNRCPIYLEGKERDLRYDELNEEICFTVDLILRGISS